MPWNNQGGGGPWGSGGGQNPWGGGRGSGSGGSGPNPPDFEEMIRKSQDRMRRMMPKGFGGKRGIILIIAVVFVGWLATGFYRVAPEEQGVVLRFGEYVRTVPPGLHYHLPSPIESVMLPPVERINTIDVGFIRAGEGTGRTTPTVQRDITEESLMLTGDENIIDIDFTVLWRIGDAQDFLFNIRNPEITVKIAAESAMREIIGQTNLQSALTEGRQPIEDATRVRLQEILNSYGAGIEVTQIQLQNVSAPPQVIDAFDDVIRAQADRDARTNEGRRYFAEVREQANGQAARLIRDAEAYRDRVVNEAEGNAQRFLYVLLSYSQQPEVTARRLYVETMEQVLRDANVILVDENSAEGNGGQVVQYLPLNELMNRSRTQQVGAEQVEVGR